MFFGAINIKTLKNIQNNRMAGGRKTRGKEGERVDERQRRKKV
jgi:hypothetical protein